MTKEQEKKRELQAIRANELFYAMTEEEREEVIKFMTEVLENREEKPE